MIQYHVDNKYAEGYVFCCFHSPHCHRKLPFWSSDWLLGAIHLWLGKYLNFQLLLLSVDITFYCCLLAAENVNNTLLFVMFHTKFISLTILVLLYEELLVADESGSSSPSLDKEHAESSSLLWSRVRFTLIVYVLPVITMLNVV